MASSTTVPMASTNANSVRILRLNPAATRQANVPTSDTIMEMEGISVLLKSCRKKYTTRITSIMAMTSVSTTLCMEAKRKSLELIIVTNSVPSGRLFLISSICTVICLLTAVGACRLEHHEKYRRLAVHLTAETIGQRTQLHIRHVLQTEHGTVTLRAYHRVLEFLHTLQASTILHRKLEHVL